MATVDWYHYKRAFGAPTTYPFLNLICSCKKRNKKERKEEDRNKEMKRVEKVGKSEIE